jgi:hypothetical protein
VTRFSLSQFGRRFWLHEIVDARASTANLGFHRCQELYPGNGLQEGARLTAHTLSVCEVTRIVIDDASGNRVTDRTWLTELIE